MWKLYDELIENIPEELTVSNYVIGAHWTTVLAGGNLGVSMTVHIGSRPFMRETPIRGARLRSVAACVKSWNFLEASLGAAALNAWYNAPECVKNLPGIQGFDLYAPEKQVAFLEFADRIAGKKVAVIGHFPRVENQLGSICELSVLERTPQMGDYPDSACEVILPEQDYVFITGITLTNKTLPRLLQLKGQHTKICLVGPTVPLSTTLFSYGADNLSGFCVTDPEQLLEQACAGGQKIFDYGRRVAFDRP